MSVLYKALERASKVREQLHVEAGPTARILPVGRRSTDKSMLPAIAMAAIVASVATGVVFLFFGDSLLSGLDQAASPATRPVPAANRKLPVLAQQSVLPPAVPASSAPPAANRPAVVSDEPPGAAGGPANAVVPAAPPSPALPPPSSAVSQDVPASPLPAPAASGPVNDQRSSLMPAKSVQADQDLPAILDRIRREKVSPAISQMVTVNRAAPNAATMDSNGSPMVSVSVQSAAGQDDLSSAYDSLLHGQYEGALRLYNKVLRVTPKSLPALIGKAAAQHKLRRYFDARESYRAVLAIDPANREALTNMTDIVADQAPEQALGDLRALQKSNPDFSPVIAEIAAIEARRDNYPAAIDALGQAIALSPDNGLYRLNLAILQDRAGMPEDAANSYKLALDLLGSSEATPVPLDGIRQRLRFLQGR